MAKSFILKLTAHIDRHFQLIACLLLFFTSAGVTGYAQKRPKVEKPKADGLTSLQTVAIESLDATIDELRDVESLPVRIDLAEGIVRSLAMKRPARCRQLLDALFENVSQMRRSYEGKKPASPLEQPDFLVRRVIKIAANLDPKLAQQYAEKYSEDEESEVGNTPPNSRRSTADLYMRLASDLIDQNPALAVSIAEKGVANTLVPATAIFLEALRKKDVGMADRFFASTLQSVAARGGDDVNELFLLYSYVFSPLVAPVVVPEGLSVLYEVANYRAMTQSRPVDPNLARQYLQVAARIILNPARYQAGGGQLSSGAVGDLYFIKIIGPRIAAYVPELSDAVNAQQSLVANYLDPDRRALSQKAADRWNASQDGEHHDAAGGATLEAKLQEAEELKDPEERDQKYYMIAANAVYDKKYDAALDIIGKLSSKYAEKGKQFITFSIAERELKDGHTERAEQWARRDDDLVRRAYILCLVADSLLAGNKDTGRAAEILAEVETITSKLDDGPEKVAVFVGAAAVYSTFNEAEAGSLLRQAVNVANKDEKFSGDTRLARVLDIGGFGFVYYLYYDKLSLPELLKNLGKKNFIPTLTDVKALKNRVARIKTTTDLCSAVLSRDPNSKM